MGAPCVQKLRISGFLTHLHEFDFLGHGPRPRFPRDALGGRVSESLVRVRLVIIGNELRIGEESDIRSTWGIL